MTTMMMRMYWGGRSRQDCVGGTTRHQGGSRSGRRHGHGLARSWRRRLGREGKRIGTDEQRGKRSVSACCCVATMRVIDVRVAPKDRVRLPITRDKPEKYNCLRRDRARSWPYRALADSVQDTGGSIDENKNDDDYINDDDDEEERELESLPENYEALLAQFEKLTENEVDERGYEQMLKAIMEIGTEDDQPSESNETGKAEDNAIEDEDIEKEDDDQSEGKLSAMGRLCRHFCMSQYISLDGDDESNQGQDADLLDPQYDELSWLEDEMGGIMYPKNVHPDVYDGQLGWNFKDEEMPIARKRFYTNQTEAEELVTKLETIIDNVRNEIVKEFGEETYNRIINPNRGSSDRDMSADEAAKLDLERQMAAAMGEKGFSNEYDIDEPMAEKIEDDVFDTLTEKNVVDIGDDVDEDAQESDNLPLANAVEEYKPPVESQSLPLGATSSWKTYEDDVKRMKVSDETYRPPIDELPSDYGDPFEDESQDVDEKSVESEPSNGTPSTSKTLSRLLLFLGDDSIIEKLNYDTEVKVNGISYDVATVKPGHLFICLRGSVHDGKVGDGHNFAALAAEKGAVAIIGQYRCKGVPVEVPQVLVRDSIFALNTIVNAFYEFPSEQMKVTAISGSSGKSSVAWLISQFLLRNMDLELSDTDDKNGPFVEGGCGLISSIEHSMYTSHVSKSLFTDDGEIWKARQQDNTKQKRCTGTRSKPLWFPIWVKDIAGYSGSKKTNIFTKPPITRYTGKYTMPTKATPDLLTLQKIMAIMCSRGITDVVVEVSSESLPNHRKEAIEDKTNNDSTNVPQKKEWNFVDPGTHQKLNTDYIDIDIAIFTNLSNEGLDSFDGSWEEFREREAYLFEKLVDDDKQVAIINLDDPEAAFFIDKAHRVPIVTYALKNAQADVYIIEEAMLKVDGTIVTVRTPIGDLQIKTSLLGRPMLSNLLATICFALVQNIDFRTIEDICQELQNPPGRLDFVRAIDEQPFFTVVDCARTPTALSKLLDTAVDLSPKPKRIITVLGCCGDIPGGVKGANRTTRALMGRVAHDKSDIVFFTNDNPRREKPENIIKDMIAGLPPEVTDIFPFLDFDWLQDPLRLDDAKYGFPGCPQFEAALYFQSQVKRFIVEDRFEAIRLAIAMCDVGDTLVVAGKGNEDFQILGDTKGWFDDKVELTDAIQRLASLKRNFVDIDANKRSLDYGKTYNMLDTSRLPWRVVTRPGSPHHDPHKPMNPYDNNYIKQYLLRRGIPEWQWRTYWP